MKRIATFTLMMVFTFSMLLIPTSSNIICVQASSTIYPQYYEETRFKDMAIAPRGGTPVEIIFEQIHFARRERVVNAIQPQMPDIASNINCGVTAATNKIAWYQRQFPQLIPGHHPGWQVGNNWFWNVRTPQIDEMIDELHIRMGGRGAVGVTFMEYLTGFGQYVHFRDLSTEIGFHRAGYNEMSPSFFTAIANGMPVSIFLGGYNITNGPSPNDIGVDVITLVRHSGYHVMVAFGYQIVSYFDADDNMFRQDVYLRVANGLSGNGWLRINTHASLHYAISLHIH